MTALLEYFTNLAILLPSFYACLSNISHCKIQKFEASVNWWHSVQEVDEIIMNQLIVNFSNFLFFNTNVVRNTEVTGNNFEPI